MDILIVDDDQPVVEVLSELLADAGHSVCAATTGIDALRHLAARQFDVFITDWKMPEPDGLTLCRSVREHTSGRYVYTILLSGRANRSDIVTGLRAGADDYICKPFDPQELLLRVDIARRLLSLGSRHVAVFAMARLAESRDPDTGQHLERVRSYCWLLAHHLAQDQPEATPEFIDNMFHTSPLHDIGKVGIPDCILLKPDRLTDEEFEIMKTHTTLGAETLEAALQQYPETPYITMAAQIARTHHERYDGSGYPAGLAGSDIPLSGRIVALADVYDALTSQRPYKRAFEHQTAKGILLQCQHHFDPMVLSAFFDLEEEFLAVRDTLSDYASESNAIPYASLG